MITLFVLLLISLIFLYIIQFNIFILLFDFKKYPSLIEVLEKTAINICKKENISVFIKTYDELNINISNEDNKALGKYIYVTDVEYLNSLNKTLKQINDLEKKYHKTYEEICKLANYESNIIKEELHYPKILLCSIEDRFYNIKYYYGTFFHEIGHHFSIKLNNDNSEEGADAMAWDLIQTRLPNYFQLIYELYFTYKIKSNLKGFRRLFAYLNFLRFLIKCKLVVTK